MFENHPQISKGTTNHLHVIPPRTPLFPRHPAWKKTRERIDPSRPFLRSPFQGKFLPAEKPCTEKKKKDKDPFINSIFKTKIIRLI